MSTKIEWTDEVWNPVTGCDKVSQGCKNCYAERIAERFWGERKFTDVQCHPERLDIPLHWRKPRRVFVNSMSDLFHEDVPEEFVDQVFAVMALSAQHTFQCLTKRPERMLEYVNAMVDDDLNRISDQACALSNSPCAVVDDWPLPNVWLGVSVEDQITADERIPLLLQTPAAVHFVSYEPALGPVDFASDSLKGIHDNSGLRRYAIDCIDWVICGGESGPGARPMRPECARSVRDQCVAADVPFFFKQWGAWLHTDQMTRQQFDDTWQCAEYSDRHFRRVGKKAAGRRLDRRTWDEFPTIGI